jgi:Uncharacterized conserved protein|nr:MAG: hypothetical protein J07AB56_09700 [Candidatus Nanosalinarum sp. J07AB56]
MRLFRSEESRRNVILRTATVLAAAVLLYVLTPSLDFLSSPDAVRDYVRGFGVLSAAAFVLLQIAQTVIAPIPGQVTGVAAGYLFGTWVGTLYSMIGVSIGSYIAVVLSRRLGRPYVERVVNPLILDRFDGFMTDRGPETLFIVFLIPGLPDDALCFVAGLSDISVARLMTVIIIARIPVYLIAAATGNSLALNNLARSAGLVAVVGVLSLLSLWKIDSILEFVDSHF